MTRPDIDDLENPLLSPAPPRDETIKEQLEFDAEMLREELQRMARLPGHAWLDEVQPPPPTFCCAVCFEESRARPAVCCRPPVCRSCFDQHVQQTLLQGPVRCPEHGCRALLSPAEVQRNVGPTTLLQYEEARVQLSTDRWCPVPTCSAPLPKSEAGRRVECVACHTVSCMRCKGAYHWGLCFASRDDGAVSSWKMTKDAKECPKCHKLIEKHGGCMHMTHRAPGGCGHEFCWLCLQDHHNHYLVLCAPLAVWHGSNKYFGPVAPIRLVTKTAFVGVALGLAGVALGLAAAGAVALVAVSPLIGAYKLGKKLRERSRPRGPPLEPRRIDAMDYGSVDYESVEDLDLSAA